MKCIRCGRNARFDLFFMGFLDYKLGYVLLECKLCHDFAFSLNMSDFSAMSEYKVSGFYVKDFTLSQIAYLLNDEGLPAKDRKALLREAIIRSNEKEVTIVNHDSFNGFEIKLSKLFKNYRRNGRFVNGEL